MEEQEGELERVRMPQRGKKIPKHFRNLLKQNVYNAWLRGMQPADLARAFSQNEKMIDRLIKEAEQESYDRHKSVDDDRARTILLDRTREVAATCFAKMDDSDNATSTASLANTILKAIDLEARIGGYIVNRVTGADGTGPVQVQAVSDRDEAISEIMQRLKQAQELSGSREVKVIEVHDEEEIIDAT